MAGDAGVGVKLEGFDEAKALLQGLPAKLRRGALRNALAAGARVVRDAARQAAPVLAASDRAVRQDYRKPGTLRQAIVVRTSKQARRAGNVGVFVNVRPAKGARFKTTVRRGLLITTRTRTLVRAGQRGAKSPNDPYYWRWVEFGTKHSAPRAFLAAGAKTLQAALDKFNAMLGRQLARLNTTPKDPLL